MNTFLTAMCLAVVASAAPQSGYNYQPVRQSLHSSLPASNSGIYSFQQSSPLTSFNVQSPQQQQLQQFNAAPPLATPLQAPQQNNVYSAQVPIGNVIQNTQSNYQPQQQQTVYQPQQQVIVSKDIFIHAAPEETEEIGNDRGVEPGPIRKNYRIVFVKAPTQNLRLNLASLKRAQASNEEKTIIYVLSKKPDIQTIQNQLSAVQPEQIAHKPEVYFIKYKTQEEANRAQQEIQAQYDSLGGSTSVSNEGIAPVSSVIGGGRVNVRGIGNGGSNDGSTSFNGGNVNADSAGTSYNGGNFNGGSGTSFNGANGGTFNGGSVGTSFNGANGGTFNGGSVGTSFNGANGGTFNGGGNIVQQQQTHQSSHGASSSAGGFSGVPSQNYLPIKKK